MTALTFIRRLTVLWIVWSTISLPIAHARMVSVPVLYTGNLQGWVCRQEQDGRCGGLLPCAELIRKQRSRYPDMLVVDCGNTLRGGYRGWSNRVRRPLDVMAEAGYDMWLPGWSDWSQLGNRDGSAFPVPVPIVAANVTFSAEGGVQVNPYLVKQVNGVRIGLVGLAASSVPLTCSAGELNDVVFNEPVESLGSSMRALREAKTDVNVLLWDTGIEAPRCDMQAMRRIIRHFPEIDVVLYNGYHRPRRIGTAFCAGVPFNTSSAGMVVLTYDTISGIMDDIHSRVLDASYDWDVLSLDTEEKELNRVIGETTSCVMNAGSESGFSPAGCFLGQAVCEELECDAAFFRWPMGTDIPSGKVTVRDIIAAYPDNAEWGTLMLTPQELIEVLQELQVWRGTDLALGCYGFAVQYGEQIEIRDGDGHALHSRKRYKVAFPEPVIASYGGKFPHLRQLAEQPIVRHSITGVDNYQAVMNYIAQQKE